LIDVAVFHCPGFVPMSKTEASSKYPSVLPVFKFEKSLTHDEKYRTLRDSAFDRLAVW
jgi:hypothetical protein